MNVFIVPSWYPSESNPIYGIFNQEQAFMLACQRPEWNIGVSTWGQGDAHFMIPISSPSSFMNLFKKHERKATTVHTNLRKYFVPAFGWTRKILRGNIEGIIAANEKNLSTYIQDFGLPEVISAQASYPAAIVAHRLSEKWGIPYTVTIRMGPFPFAEFLDSRGQLKEIIRKPLIHANRLIATSPSLEQRLGSFGFSNVAVINNPVDTDFFHPEKSVTKSRCCQLLTIGRLETEKGIDILLEALSHLEIPFELRIGGSGSKEQEYRRLCSSLHLDEKVTWLGELSRAEVKKEMQRCSFYILPSRYETFGNVLIEAMACGKPVVATKCGGPEDIVTGKVGYFSTIHAQDLSAQISSMMNDYHLFDANKIRESTLARFSPSSWANKLENLFKELVQKSV